MTSVALMMSNHPYASSLTYSSSTDMDHRNSWSITDRYSTVKSPNDSRRRPSYHTDVTAHENDDDDDDDVDAITTLLDGLDTAANFHRDDRDRQRATMATHARGRSASAKPTQTSSPAAAAAAAPAAANTTTTRNATRRKTLKHDISFNVGSRYRVCDVIGEGAYGVVCSAIHRPTGLKVAIKKIQPFEHQMFALRTLRELKLLRYWQESEVSENIISILDIVKPASLDAFNEVYLIQELMETDLHRVIRSQKLSDDHAQYFTYQILRALKAIHSADVIHRDLKPGNLLLNANCDLKVCDFGLARSLRTAEPAQGSETGLMTEYVATRWYRAPEIMLTFKQYSKAIDVWAVGCILGEMLSGKPMFPGRDYHDQINHILLTLGTPSLDDFYAINSRRSREYIRTMPFYKRRPFTVLYPQASAEAIDFLEKTLTFSPKKRASVDELLAHPYLAAYHDETDEPECEPMPAEMWQCDHKTDLEKNSTERLREQLYDEIRAFQPLI